LAAAPSFPDQPGARRALPTPPAPRRIPTPIRRLPSTWVATEPDQPSPAPATGLLSLVKASAASAWRGQSAPALDLVRATGRRGHSFWVTVTGVTACLLAALAVRLPASALAALRGACAETIGAAMPWSDTTAVEESLDATGVFTLTAGRTAALFGVTFLLAAVFFLGRGALTALVASAKGTGLFFSEAMNTVAVGCLLAPGPLTVVLLLSFVPGVAGLGLFVLLGLAALVVGLVAGESAVNNGLTHLARVRTSPALPSALGVAALVSVVLGLALWAEAHTFAAHFAAVAEASTDLRYLLEGLF
jgi:hypothetical protein